VGGNGNAIVTGSTSAFSTADFPVAGQLPSSSCSSGCCFLASLEPDGSALNYSGVLEAELGNYTTATPGASP
jgi:hypothetical protein